MNIKYRASLSLLFAWGTALATAEAAMAGDRPDLAQIKVRTDDLDLRTSAGAQRMDQRIRCAANHVCDDGFGTRGIEKERCVYQAIEEARVRRNAALAQAQSGQVAAVHTASAGEDRRSIASEDSGDGSLVRR